MQKTCGSGYVSIGWWHQGTQAPSSTVLPLRVFRRCQILLASTNSLYLVCEKIHIGLIAPTKLLRSSTARSLFALWDLGCFQHATFQSTSLDVAYGQHEPPQMGPNGLRCHRFSAEVPQDRSVQTLCLLGPRPPEQCEWFGGGCLRSSALSGGFGWFLWSDEAPDVQQVWLFQE